MQQRTSVLPPRHPVKAMEGLSRQIALPHEHAPQRFPSFPALERTAVMGFNAPVQVEIPTGMATKFMVCRQAAWPVWAEQSFDTAAYRTYQATYTTNGILPASTTQQDYTILNLSAVNAGVVAGGASVANRLVGTPGSSSFSLPYPVLGMDGGAGTIPWTYVPPSWALNVVSGALNWTAAFSTDITVELDVWTAPGEVGQLELVLPSFSGAKGATFYSTILGTEAGFWVRPRTACFRAATALTMPAQALVNLTVSSQLATGLSNTGTNLGTLTFAAIAANRTFLPLAAPAEFSNSTLPWRATRTTATALLLTNVSQVLNKAGTILAGRVSPNVLSPWEVNQAYINNLHPAEKAFLPLETGFYTYAPPSTDLQSFWDYVLPRTPVSGLGTVATDLPSRDVPVYRLDNNSLVNVAYLTPGAVSEQVAANIDWHIEFRTSSALFPIGLSTMTLETLHQAQVALAMAGFFFENDTHKTLLGKIIAAVKSIAPAILPTVAKVASAHPIGAALVTGARTVYNLTRKNNTSVPATSGAASGILKSQRQRRVPARKKRVVVARRSRKR